MILNSFSKYQWLKFVVRSTVVEWATYMRVYAGSSPTSADHRKELIQASSCSLNDVKRNDKVKKEQKKKKK